mgnify:CR=1 FL=1
MERTSGRGRLVSVGGTLVGYGLLAVGIGMVGVTAYEFLLASGRPLATASVVPSTGVGVVCLVAGYLLLRRVLDGDADPDEPEVEPSAARASDAYQFDT